MDYTHYYNIIYWDEYFLPPCRKTCITAHGQKTCMIKICLFPGAYLSREKNRKTYCPNEVVWFVVVFFVGVKYQWD